MGAYTSSLEREGEVRQFADHGRALLGSAGGLTVLQGVFEPGWRWSNDVKPIAGTESCQTHHLGIIVSGRMGIRLDDGTEFTVGPGDLMDVPRGHDAWTLGDEACVVLDVSPEATRYARGRDATAGSPEDQYMTTIRRGYEAFNTGDIATLQTLLSHDVAQHVPGTSQIAGQYKGIDAVLAYYGKLAELTGGQFRADLIDVFSDGEGHATALHQITATRNGVTRISRGTILFTFLGDKVTDLLQMSNDLPGDDAFFA